MRGLTLVNMAGVMTGAIYVGAVFGGGYVPWFGLASTLAFLTGIFLPFLREHGELRRGLDRVETEFRTEKRRDLGLATSELFTDEEPPPIWPRGSGGRQLSARALAVAGGLLLAVDAVMFTRHGALATEAARTITNF